jgi:hypothetical protein
LTTHSRKIDESISVSYQMGSEAGPATPHLRVEEKVGIQILVDQLRIQGCDRIFIVPGESFLAD